MDGGGAERSARARMREAAARPRRGGAVGARGERVISPRSVRASLASPAFQRRRRCGAARPASCVDSRN